MIQRKSTQSLVFAISGIAIALMITGTASGQNWRGHIDVSVENDSHGNITLKVLSPNGNVVGQGQPVAPHVTMTWQHLAAGDVVQVTGGGQTYSKTVGHSNMSLTFNGWQLIDNNNSDPGHPDPHHPHHQDPNQPRPQNITITIFNQMANQVEVGWALPHGGGTMRDVVSAGGFKQQNTVAGAQLNASVNGRFYNTTVNEQGALVISNTGAVTFNGRPVPQQNNNPAPDSQVRLGFQSQISSLGGLQITSVNPGSLAEVMGLQRGDIVKSVNGVDIRNGSSYLAQLNRAKSAGGKVVLRVQISGTNRIVPLHTSVGSPVILGTPIHGSSPIQGSIHGGFQTPLTP